MTTNCVPPITVKCSMPPIGATIGEELLESDAAVPERTDHAVSHRHGNVALRGSVLSVRENGRTGNGRTLGRVSIGRKQSGPGNLSRVNRMRQAVLLSFCDPLPEQCLELRALSRRQWEKLMRWLDVSGLALQFFDRIAELQQKGLLPAPVYERLQQNLTDNTARTNDMITESIGIQREFQAANLRYAVLKGVSFWPNSVARPELRLQFDLDFLVAEEDLEEARRILAYRGYRLYATTEACLEFKRNERPGLTLKDLYRHVGSWMVEVHVESSVSGSRPVLGRVEWREFYGFRMPVLSPGDLFLRQGLHAYKHVSHEFTRAAHLVEFRRHVLFRAGDDAFWRELHRSAKDDEYASIGLGVVALLISRLMGDFAPDALKSWTVDRLPARCRLWVELYANHVFLGNAPGSKLYLLLQDRTPHSGTPASRPLWQYLVPLTVPSPAVRARRDDSLATQFARFRMLVASTLIRLRFHVVEGLRFLWESRRWRRHLERIAS